MKNALKIFLCAFLWLVLLFIFLFGIFGMSYMSQSAFAEEKSITVNITVTDITDVTNPFNVLVPRRSLEVEYKDLATYGSTFSDIEAEEGITYLHALASLHEELYGTSDVDDYLMLTSDGETHYFMGRSIDSIMYKNGDDIFTLPQNVRLSDGDEINVCLYTAGHQQMIATFDKSVIRVPVDEVISFVASEHYDSPVDNTPISGAEITDENGILLTDGDGNVITSDELGNFTVSFDEVGEYIVSIMPEINYYMTGMVQEVVEYTPVSVTKTYSLPYNHILDMNTLPDEVKKSLYPEGLDESKSNYAVYINSKWSGEPDAAEMVFSYTSTELEKVVEYIPDEPKQMITYTPPFCVIDVTDELIVDRVYFSIGAVCDNVYIDLKNYDTDSCTVYVAAYKDGRFEEAQSKVADKSLNFVFGTGNDYYKVFFWDGLTPKTKAYVSN